MQVNEIKSITAENKFTPWVSLHGDFSLDITGITNSTVTLQRTRDHGITVHDVQQFTNESFFQGHMADTACKFRVGVKAGDYGSDTVLVILEA